MLLDLLSEYLNKVEAIVLKLENDKNNLLFRYDNAPHFPDFTNFPHHKHLPDKVIDTSEISIFNVIEEARDVI